MLAHSKYKKRLDNPDSSRDITYDLEMSSCWNGIHMVSQSSVYNYADFKPSLEKQWYTIRYNKYVANKEIVDDYLDFLVKLGLPIKYSITETEGVVIDAIIEDLNSLAERKLVSYLVRFLGYYLEAYNRKNDISIYTVPDEQIRTHYDSSAIVSTILELHKTFPNMSRLKCLMIGGMINQTHLGYVQGIYYNSMNQFLVPQYTTVKEFFSKLRVMEDALQSRDNYCMHKHFKGIPNTNPQAEQIKFALVKKDYKTALDVFNTVNKEHSQTLKPKLETV